MKTIIYGFFIYVFLATTPGFASKKFEIPGESGLMHVDSKCNLTEIINTSEYVKDCKEYVSSIRGTEALPAFKFDNIVKYLCAGIFETANRICELNVNSLPTNITTFKNAIEKSQLVSKDLSKVCSAITSSIPNSSYTSTINYTSHPNIQELNKNLNLSCERICWTASSETSANSLCSVLLWEIGIIVNFRTQPLSHVDHHPSKKLHDTKPVHQPQQGSDHANQNPDVIHGNQNEVDNSQAKHQDGTANAEKLSTKSTTKAPIISSPHKIGSKPDLSEVKVGTSHDSSGNPDNPAGENSNAGAKPGGAKPDDVPQGSGVENQIAGNIPNGNDNIGEIDEEADGDQKPDPVDIGEILDNGENNERVPETNDPPPRTNGNINSHSPEQAPASSNHDNQDNPGGQEQTATNRERVASRGPNLAHSEPLDPPQHFFAYFMAVSFICLLCYVGYHKKHKIMAIIFEGRKSRGGRGRRRPNTAGYRKLDCNLEEAVTSQCNSNVTHVIY